jgi:hypothetical protein
MAVAVVAPATLRCPASLRTGPHRFATPPASLADLPTLPVSALATVLLAHVRAFATVSLTHVAIITPPMCNSYAPRRDALVFTAASASTPRRSAQRSATSSHGSA